MKEFETTGILNKMRVAKELSNADDFPEIPATLEDESMEKWFCKMFIPTSFYSISETSSSTRVKEVGICKISGRCFRKCLRIRTSADTVIKPSPIIIPTSIPVILVDYRLTSR